MSYPFFILLRILWDPDSMPNHKPIQPAWRIFPSNLSVISERTLAMPIHCIPIFSSINKSQSFSSDLILQLIKLSLNRMVETPYFSLIFLNSNTMFSGDRIRYVLPHNRFSTQKTQSPIQPLEPTTGIIGIPNLF